MKCGFITMDLVATAPTAPTRLEALRTLRYGVLDVAFSTSFVTLVAGTFLVGFVKALGGQDRWVGLIAALPALAGLLQIIGGTLGRAYPGYRGFVRPGGLMWRIFHIPLVILPFLPWPNEVRLMVLTACIGLAAISVQLVNPIYSDWIAELLPVNQRGAYFSQRTFVATIVGSVIGMLGGIVMDQMKRMGREMEGFAFIFGAGLLCALISQIFLDKMRDIPRPEPVPANVRETIRGMRAPWKDAAFRPVLFYLIVFVIGQSFAGNLFTTFALETLKMDYLVLQALGVSSAIGTLATVKFWGYIADRYGNRPLLTLLTTIIVFTPVMWLFCVPGKPVQNAVILILGHVFVGAGWNGIAVTQMGLMTNIADAKARANYLGMASALQSVLGGIAPLVGALVMERLRISMPAETAYKTLFLSVVFMRALSFIWVARIQEPGSKSIAGTIAHLRRFSPQGARALRQLTSGAAAETRAEAIRTVGSRSFGIATGELAAALRDPAPHIRRAAAESLAKIGDADAAEALIQHIRENPMLVDEETLEALGTVRHPESVAALLPFLDDPRSILRRTAARALGRLNDPSAITALMDASRETGDSDLRRAAIQALRNLQATQAAETIGEALYDPHPSVRTAAAEAVAELQLAELAPQVRQALEWFEPDTSSELAYALGCIGELDDLPTVLRVAELSTNETTRRRSLLGAARLMDVEHEVYRLMMSPEFTRVREIESMLRPVMRQSQRLREAFVFYSEGQERVAINRLADTRLSPELHRFRDSSVEEAFLVVAMAFVRATQSDSGKPLNEELD